MNRRNGFTLVELVVVILILGILAGVAAPKLFNTSSQATDNGLKQTLAIVRDAIEMYHANNGSLPTCATDGVADFQVMVKPYIRGPFPKCPVGSVKDEKITPESAAGITGSAGATTGWKYSPLTGEFIANTTATDKNAVRYDTY
jgi:general secretion pathway protein G